MSPRDMLLFCADIAREDGLFIVELDTLEAPVVLAPGEWLKVNNNGKRVTIMIKRKPLV